jgi:hypothetical protein
LPSRSKRGRDPRLASIDAADVTHRLALTHDTYIRVSYGLPSTGEELAAAIVPGTPVMAVVAEGSRDQVSLLRHPHAG